MARVQYAGIIQGVRGTLGGVVFSSGKSGPFIRPWARGGNPQALSQQFQRSAIAGASESWRSLSPSERAAWAAWAADPAQEQLDVFGNAFYISGWQWYARVGAWLYRMYLAFPIDPPSSRRPAAPSLISLSVYQTGGPAPVLSWPTDEFDGVDLVVFGALVDSPVQATTSTARYFEWYALPGPVGSTSETLPAIEDLVGEVQAGQQVFVRAFRQTADGQRSAAGTIVGEIQPWP